MREQVNQQKQGVSMRERCKNLLQYCLSFGQLGKIVFLMSFCVLSVEAQSLARVKSKSKSNVELLQGLNPFAKSNTRGPSNFVPNDDIEPLPFENRKWTQDILVEDDAGVLSDMRSKFMGWKKTEDYARNWNIESTGLFKVPTEQKRKEFFNRRILKYADKRFSGEVKNAERGSTLHRVGKVHKALRPQTTASITDNIKVRFKARVLQGKIIMKVENPYLEYESSVNADGRVRMHAKKDFKQLQLKASMDYDAMEEEYVARVDRPLTQKLTARVSSAQNHRKVAFSGQSNKTVELLFNHSF